ncbi:hypothetical protein D3C87_78810 [compost metagenome]
MTRLKKIAELQDLGEMNMSTNVLNTIIQTKDASDTVSNVIYRRNMNSNTKFVVEIWELTGEKYAVFYGHFQGQWTQDNVSMSDIFDNLNEAQLYVQNQLQGEAEVNELVVATKRLNGFKKLLAAGSEPDYNEISKNFQKEMNIPSVEMKHKDHLNKYYDQWTDYMKKYYPQWSQYPAYIWRGWNYFTDSTQKDEDDKKDESEQDNFVENETNNETPTSIDSISTDTMTDGGGEV